MIYAIECIVQGFAAMFLICVGWLLAGDFLAWSNVHYSYASRTHRRLIALTVFGIYFLALMLFRYGPIKP